MYINKLHRNSNPISSFPFTMSSGVDRTAGALVPQDETERKFTERISRGNADSKDAKKKLAMGKLAPPSSASNSVQARTESVIKAEEIRGKRELVAPNMAMGIKGKSAGFYCETCDLTYKDSLSYLDHLNSSERMLHVLVPLVVVFVIVLALCVVE